MAINNYAKLIQKVKSGRKKTVVLVQADDKHALEAVIHANEIVEAVLVGDVEKIEGVLLSLGRNPADFNLVQVPEGEHPVVTAAGLIHDGKGEFIMKGNMTTGDLLKGVLSKESGLRKSELMSHLAIIEVPSYHKLLFLTDSGMCVYPNLEQKKEILLNTVNFVHAIGYERPNVAALCAVEEDNPKMPETTDAFKLKRFALSNEIPGCYVEGPISYDLTMNPESAQIKGFDCPCSGDFDILLAPNMLVGNILGKCLVYTAGGKMAGLILGAKVPIVVTSRGSSVEEKYNSIAIAASA